MVIQRSSSLPNLSYAALEPIGLLHFDKLIESGAVIHKIANKQIRLGMSVLLNQIREDGFVERKSQLNSEARPIFVGCQACVEFSLVEKLQQNSNSVICIVHTDTPTTPLCVKDVDDIQSVISEFAKKDNGTQLSVEIRKPIVHSLCSKCNSTNPYNVVYNQSRLKAAEQKMYTSEGEQQQALDEAQKQDAIFESNVGDLNKHIKKMTHAGITPELSGASYLYLQNNEWRYFGISSQQAKDASDKIDWAIWDVAVRSLKGEELVSKYSQVWPSTPSSCIY